MTLAGVYPHYVAKAEKKGRTKAEVDEIIRWLTGYTQKQLESILEKRTNIETFSAKARMNPSRTLVTGAICGVRVEEIEDPVMQGIRSLDKLIDELAKGRPMEKDPAEGLTCSKGVRQGKGAMQRRHRNRHSACRSLVIAGTILLHSVAFAQQPANEALPQTVERVVIGSESGARSEAGPR